MTIDSLTPVAWLIERFTDDGQPFSSSLRFYEEPSSDTVRATPLYALPDVSQAPRSGYSDHIVDLTEMVYSQTTEVREITDRMVNAALVEFNSNRHTFHTEAMRAALTAAFGVMK